MLHNSYSFIILYQIYTTQSSLNSDLFIECSTQQRIRKIFVVTLIKSYIPKGIPFDEILRDI